jgi:hypothetical protein
METITGPFDNYDDANDAVGELEATGVPCSDKGVVLGRDRWIEKLRGAFKVRLIMAPGENQ